MKAKSIFRFTSIAVVLTSVHAAPLLTDNFNTNSYGASTFNSYLAADQAGSIAPITYAANASGGDWAAQHSNGGALLLANAGNSWASLNHDFSIEANLANKPLVIQFDAWVTDGQSWAWLGFGIGPAQGTDFYAQPYGKNFTQSAGSHTYKFVISDTAGTGSGFNGITNGSKVDFYIDSVYQSTTTVTLNAGAGFITFKQDQWDGWSIGHVDNLSIEMDTPFPGSETLTWTGATDANWDETTANWSNVNSFTKWYSNSSKLNSVVFDATGAAQLNPAFALTRPLTTTSITFDTNGYTLGGSVALGNSPSLVANADATVSATLAGSAGITKSGASKISLTGTSSYTGVTTLQDGVLNAASIADNGTNSSLGAGTGDTNPDAIGLLFRGGTLQYTGATAQSTNRAIRVGTQGGTIDASGSDPSATLRFTSSASANFFENPGNRTLTFTGTNTGDNTFAMAIGQAFGTTTVVKNGPGKWILSGANTYSGSTIVNGGTLSLTSAYLDNTSAVTLASGAKLDLNYSGNDIIGSLEINGSGPLPGGVYNSSHSTYGSYFTGTGSLMVLNGADGTWSSLVNGVWDDTANWSGGTIASGFNQTASFNQTTGVTVTLDAAKTIGNLAFAGSDYTIAGSSTLTLDSVVAPSISVDSDRTATISANIGGTLGLKKTGAGTLKLIGIKSYSGATTVDGGTLELSGATRGNSQIQGSLNVNPGATFAFTNGDGTGFGWTNPVTAVTVNGGTINAISGSHLGFFGTPTTITLENGGTLQGSWQWNGESSLAFYGYGNSTNTISGNIVLRGDGGANHPFNVDNGSAAIDLLVSANLSDQWPEVWWVPASGLTKSGAGTMVLSGTNTYDGNTIVNEGVLEVTSAGSLRFRPTSNGVSNAVSGSAALSFLGTVDLDLSAANLTKGNIWNLFNLGGFSSATLSPAAVTSGLGAFTEVTPGTWELAVTGAKWVFTEADGNLAYVNAASPYATWGSTYGLSAGSESGDLDGDGLTNFQEFAFGLIPNDSSSVNPIISQVNPTTGQFSYQRLAASGLTYTIWTTTDLVTWTQDTSAVQNVTTGNPNDTVQVTLTGAPLTASKLFVRVKAE